jgi:hypothetical protein
MAAGVVPCLLYAGHAHRYHRLRYIMLVMFLVAVLIIMLGCWPIWALAQHIKRSKDYSLFCGWQPAKLRQPELYAAQLCRGLEQFAVALAIAALSLMIPSIPIWLKASLLIGLPFIVLLHAIIRAEQSNS